MDEFRSIISENIEHKNTPKEPVYTSSKNDINHEDIEEPSYNSEEEVDDVVEQFMRASMK